jgi:hypothetical protein
MPSETTERDGTLVVEATGTDAAEFVPAVLDAVGDELDADPSSLPPLQESIDPELVNELWQAGGRSATTLSFEYLGYEVVLNSDGVIRLTSLR